MQRRKTVWSWGQGIRCSVCWRRSRDLELVGYRRGGDQAQPQGRIRIRSPIRCRLWVRPHPRLWRSCCGGSSSFPCGGARPRHGRHPATMIAAWRAAAQTAGAVDAGAGRVAAARGHPIPTWAWKTCTAP